MARKIASRKRQLLSNNTISVSIMPKMPTEIPLFPLPIVVFPQEKRALHIFEERYKAMVRYCLDANEVFGMILVNDGKISETGCTVRISRVLHEFEDGRMDILVSGQERFMLLDIFQRHLYLSAQIKYMREPMLVIRKDLREKVIAQHLKWLELNNERFNLSEYEVPYASYIVASKLPIPLDEKQKILQTPAETDRLMMLSVYFETVLPKVQTRVKTEQVIRSDGHTSALPPDAKFNLE
jgi:ATP-dependent Lon protease